MISKEDFVSAIEEIRHNYYCPPLDIYDYKPEKTIDILERLRGFFPKDENGFCDIEHYCFFMDFGKSNSEADYESPEMLYDRLFKIDLKTKFGRDVN